MPSFLHLMSSVHAAHTPHTPRHALPLNVLLPVLHFPLLHSFLSFSPSTFPHPLQTEMDRLSEEDESFNNMASRLATFQSIMCVSSVCECLALLTVLAALGRRLVGLSAVDKVTVIQQLCVYTHNKSLTCSAADIISYNIIVCFIMFVSTHNVIH